uniref:rRNA-processing protein EBP2 n=1 Tax=Romanomermis culicivorax TaxID=13658 RepID=A0A915KIQ3_ROMCU
MVEIIELKSNPIKAEFMKNSIRQPDLVGDDDSDGAGFSSASDEDDYDSDRELQVAFEKGYIKPGLNVVQEVVKKKWINNVSAMKSKLSEFKKDLDWIERMDVTVERPIDEEESAIAENDFKREVSFVKQAQAALAETLPKLHKLNIVTKRPEDYFAEMFKSDEHMKKVRSNLLNLQVSKQKSEAARRFREEKKFAVRIQKEVVSERQQEKKMLSDAVRKHKKGMKDQFERIIGENADPEKRRKNQKRALKDAKYGHGGRKKRAKSNTAQSSADMSSYDSSVFSKHRGSNNKNVNKKQKQRPGKNRRAKMKKRK